MLVMSKSSGCRSLLKVYGIEGFVRPRFGPERRALDFFRGRPTSKHDIVVLCAEHSEFCFIAFPNIYSKFDFPLSDENRNETHLRILLAVMEDSIEESLI